MSISASFPTQQSESPVRISDWTGINKSSLVGVFNVTVPGPFGLVLCGCMVHRSAGGQKWIQIPGAAQLEKNGAARRLGDGKIAFRTVIRFSSNDCHKQFEDLVLKELQKVGHI